MIERHIVPSHVDAQLQTLEGLMFHALISDGVEHLELVRD
jgi:hypothetical protein